MGGVIIGNVGFSAGKLERLHFYVKKCIIAQPNTQEENSTVKLT